MAEYECPVCHERVQRDLVVFLQHTETHVIAEVKKRHPQWMAASGLCQKCAEYFRYFAKTHQAPPGQHACGTS